MRFWGAAQKPLQHSDTQRQVRVFWCRIPSRPNFGDALTPWLVGKLTGKDPIFVRPEDPREKFFVAGSILSYAGRGCTVWGSGILHRDDVVSRAANLLAVRGPLSRARCLECGVPCPEIYGDPASLLPRFYQPHVTERRGIGMIAHFADSFRLGPEWHNLADVRIIDIQSPIETVIDHIARSEFVISTSLHGIIASHVYGVPAVWAKFRSSSRDDCKFHDYLLSAGEEPAPPLLLEYQNVDKKVLTRCRPSLPKHINVDDFIRVCPLR